MDHFNATVKDGKLVSTRRGLQVSKHKFNGISFVNSCPQEPPTPGTSQFSISGSSRSQKQQRQRRSAEGDSRTSQNVPCVDNNFVMKMPQGKGRKRLTSREKPSRSPSGASSHVSSRASSQAPSLEEHFSQFFVSQGSDSQVDLEGSNAGLAFPASMSQMRPSSVSEKDWNLFHRYFQDVPRRIYPYEDLLTHNPGRATEFYYMAVKDTTSFYCILMSGSITEAILDYSDAETKGYAYHISKICSILNRKLDHGKAVDAVTLCCIATLAAIGCYVGRFDHWHMHMRGLQKVLDMQNECDVSQPWLAAKMHKADIKGAAALGGNPYLPFSRRFPDVSAVVPIEIRNSASASLLHLLNPLRVSSPVIASLSALSVFASAVRLARCSSSAVLFDPHAFTDEWLGVSHALVTWPGSLREGTAIPFVGNGPDSKDNATSSADRYLANQRLRSDVPIIPAGPLGAGSALRIAGLLYLKELLPDWPRNLGGYAVLLSLLRSHLEGILDTMRVERAWKRIPAATAVTFDDGFVDPHLRRDGDKTHTKPGYGTSLTTRETSPVSLSVASLRPIIIFLCLTGNLLSLIGDENEARYTPAERYPRSIFQRCLREVLCHSDADGAKQGFGSRAEVEDESIGEEDLVLLRLFDLRDIRGERWDDRAAVRELLMEEL